MREIKFRAWYEKLNTMITFENLEELKQKHYEDCVFSEDEYYPLSDIDFLFNCPTSFEKLIIEQYIGLKDDNGVDIYEGDIVKVVDCNVGTNFIGVVSFEHGSFMIDDEGSTHYRWIDFLVTVIGNIHQHIPRKG